MDSLLQSLLSTLLYSTTVILAALMTAHFSHRRENLILRLVLSLISIYLVSTAFTVWIHFTSYTQVIVWLHSIKFFTIFLLSGLMTFICYRITIWEATFFAVVGYCIQHISGRGWTIVEVIFPNIPTIVNTILSILFFFAIASLFYYLFLRKQFKDVVPRVYFRFQLVMAFVVVFICIFYNSFGLSYGNRVTFMEEAYGINDNLGARINIMVSIFSILIAFLTFLLSFGSVNLKAAVTDNQLLEQLLKEKKEQYEKEEQDIKAINSRLHDLKHYVAALGTNNTIDDDKKMIFDTIVKYDAKVKTGNDTLDVLLTSKNLLCNEKGIRFNCMIDGKQLDFIPKYELYTIFGNAIDNAIDSVENLDAEKKLISISQKETEQNYSIIMENYYSGTIEFHNGLPQTKKDTVYHGFGLKSIKMIVEKYGGKINVETYEDVFSLVIEFPKKQN